MRVFVSSPIRGYENYRSAVREAIGVLGEVPVMAEHDFGAKPVPPREACLEGVRQSEVYVGLFGARYGYISEGGKSATQEEFEEARRLGLTILIFEQDVEKEDPQNAFLSTIKGYEEGYFVDTYRSPSELKDKVIRALANLRGPTISRRRSAGDAARLFEEQIRAQRTLALVEPWMRVAACTSVSRIALLSRAELATPHVKERLLHPALFGDSSVLSPHLGFQEVLEEDVLRFIQPAEQMSRQVSSALEVHTDGSIQISRSLGWERSAGLSTLRHFLIDEERVYATLFSAVTYLRHIFVPPELQSRVVSVFVQVRMGGLANKMLGKMPTLDPSSVTIPTHSLPEPLIVPRTPYEFARRDLVDTASTANVVAELIRRQFVLAGAYYGRG